MATVASGRSPGAVARTAAPPAVATVSSAATGPDSDSATVGTALGFDGVGTSGRIDWILHDDTSFDTIEAHIDRTSFIDGAGVKRYPSDHFPINAIIRPTPVPEPATGLILLGGATAAMMLRRGRGRR